ncbi:MAG: hypothetical protein HN982_05290 [Candidatus Marinimicrobia bacterium]|jgi:DNA repair photolyase|nr:hypothetical protein [Candidatus Neomarinimicrobiota bacterium]MBT6936981.1 hypothetical protein [Candidatus Neomarinimicrobiota bacterium]
MNNKFIPKRVIVTPSSEGNTYTNEILDRVLLLNPNVKIIYSENDDPDFPADVDKFKYMKNSLVLVERKGPFITTFESPGDIVEKMITVISLGWHCALNCEYCYLQNSISRVKWMMLYTNRDRIKEELEREPFVHKTLLTLWNLHSHYQQKEQMKITGNFHQLSNDIRKTNLQKKIIIDDNSAIRFLVKNLTRHMNTLVPGSSLYKLTETRGKLKKLLNRINTNTDEKTILKLYDKIKIVYKKLYRLSDSPDIEDFHKNILNIINYLDPVSELNTIKPIKKGLDSIAKDLEEEAIDILPEQLVNLKKRLVGFYENNSSSRPGMLIAEYTDILAIDHIAETVNWFVGLMNTYPQMDIELPTKTAVFEELIDEHPDANVKVTMNFNPEKVIKLYEHGTANLNDRIAIMKRMQSETNYKLNIRVEPIIFYDGYENEYIELIKKLMTEIGTKQVLTISMGCIRIGVRLKSRAIKHYGANNLMKDLVKPEGSDTKWRNNKHSRIDIYKKLINIIREYSEDIPIELGAELPDVWDSLGLNRIGQIEGQTKVFIK